MIRDKSVLDLFEEKYRPVRLLGCSEHCIRQYRWNIRRFGEFLGREARIGDLRDASVSNFLAHLAAQGKATATVNCVRKQLLALWRFAAERRWLKRFPGVRKLREPERVPQAWTLDQIARLLEACSQQNGTYEGIPAADWLVAIHYLWWDTAERRGATLAILLADVDLARKTLLVRAETRKGKTRDRLYRIQEDTAAAIGKIMQPERRLLFPYPYHRTTFYNRYRRMLVKCGLPTGRRWGPHAMRRSHASYLKLAGGDAQESLDHSNPSTTKLYIAPEIAGQPAPSTMLPPLPKRAA